MQVADSETGEEALWSRLVAGDRRALGRAISLCESARQDHRRVAEALVTRAAAAPQAEEAFRVGFTGPAGVGKSTLLDVLGERLFDAGHRPAVLAVDPSSRQTGGSLLGDRTRMTRLARRGAFVRSSPTRGHLGGVTTETRETALLCAAAGFDPILIETVGVGQNESEVSDLVDLLVVLLQPGAGDELQGMKRGLLEHADLLAVAQADGARRQLAEETRARFEGALSLFEGADRPPIALLSAHEDRGVAELWAVIEDLREHRRATGAWTTRRARQQIQWFRAGVVARLLRALEPGGALGERSQELERAVAAGKVTVPEALCSLFDEFPWPGAKPTVL